MTATVVLHVGAMKTGTSFVQAVLSANKQRLAEHGVLWPGATWAAQVEAVDAVRARRHGTPSGPDAWDVLVDELTASPLPRAVVSMEGLAGVPDDTVRTIVQSLAPMQAQVVVTLRDLGRTLPAQWQESVQNGNSWTYAEYLEAVTAKKPRSTAAGEHFWRRQSWPRIVRRWGDGVGMDHVTVVTVPPPHSPRGLLWQRFSEAVGVPRDLDTEVRANESIGAVSAELMRRISERSARADAGSKGRGVLKHVLAKEVLAANRSNEPTLVLPRAYRDVVARRSEEMATAVGQLAPRVVGDLADLTVRDVRPDGPVTDDPSVFGDDTLLDTAVFAIVGLARTRKQRP